MAEPALTGVKGSCRQGKRSSYGTDQARNDAMIHPSVLPAYPRPMSTSARRIAALYVIPSQLESAFSRRCIAQLDYVIWDRQAGRRLWVMVREVTHGVIAYDHGYTVQRDRQEQL